MSKMEKAYQPQDHEAQIYKIWEKSGAFEPSYENANGKPPFSIIMPPPNANGALHTGHAMYAIEDVITRYKRMQGYPTLWLPGTDHAGIETQFVYERDVLAKQGKTRFDLGPEQFYKDVMDFTLENQSTIINQLKSLGLSADWSKLKFTLEEDVIDNVDDTFKKLHDDDLIYRGNRIVNWCTRCNAAFADVEVKYIEREDEIYTLDYGTVQIATTRPETIFADSAVAVNPKDQRFKELVGKTATIPLLDRPIPIIADSHVDPAFGTGALKVTPGHDSHDYEIGLRHNLPEISVIDLDGIMINVPSEIAGLSIEDARKKTVELLQMAGKLIDRQPLTHSVGTHDRCGTVIEPLITEQWFLKVKPLVEPALKALKNGDVKVYPKNFEKVLASWLENLHDWNISRQIWWGIRIPIYYKTSNDPDKKPHIVARSEEEAQAYYGKGNYRAETDTFDTWFSSSQWPYITLKTTGQLEDFYPTSFMGTARDILTKWVATMMLMGIYRTGKVPFRDVYLWGMVNDEHGKKISKSKGNVIDPLVLTEKYGTDALRLALTIGISPGRDGALSEKKVEGYRNFNNKLWNVARFVLDKVGDDYSPSDPEPRNLADKWIMHRLASETAAITRALDNYRFSEAGERIYSLLWNDFADWYIEAAKIEPNNSILVFGLEEILKLTHPFAPFVTEAIWQNLPWQSQNLIVSPWPTISNHTAYKKESAEFELIMALVSQIRQFSAQLQLKKPTLLYLPHNLIQQESSLIKKLANLGDTKLVEQGSGLRLVSGSLDAWLDVDEKTIKDFASKLEAKKAEVGEYLSKLEAQLANKKYIKSAPVHLVEQTRNRKAENEELLKKLNEQIESISG